MMTPWYDPIAFAWIPGTAFGCLGGCWGAMAGILAPKGKGRRLVLGTWLALMVAAAAFLIASIVALSTGQPRGIWYGLGLPGLQGTVLMPVFLPLILMRYRQAEERKMAAEDLSIRPGRSSSARGRTAEPGSGLTGPDLPASVDPEG